MFVYFPTTADPRTSVQSEVPPIVRRARTCRSPRTNGSRVAAWAACLCRSLTAALADLSRTRPRAELSTGTPCLVARCGSRYTPSNARSACNAGIFSLARASPLALLVLALTGASVASHHRLSVREIDLPRRMRLLGLTTGRHTRSQFRSHQAIRPLHRKAGKLSAAGAIGPPNTRADAGQALASARAEGRLLRVSAVARSLEIAKQIDRAVLCARRGTGLTAANAMAYQTAKTQTAAHHRAPRQGKKRIESPVGAAAPRQTRRSQLMPAQ
jgi:hypothetical protein